MNRKKTVAAVLLLLIFLPGLLRVASYVTKKTYDVALHGDTKPDKPDIATETFLSGEFQRLYSDWFEKQLPLRGIAVKAYKTLQYSIFHQGGNRVVGKNGDIFEQSYIDGELCINSVGDLSVPGNQAVIDNYIEKLELLQSKLSDYGKYLYVYISANKAEFHRGNIPDRYFYLADESAVRPVDYFRERIKETKSHEAASGEFDLRGYEGSARLSRVLYDRNPLVQNV